MPGTYSPQRCTTASTFVRTMRSSPSRSRSWNSPALPKPALLTRTETFRPRARISATSRSRAAWSDRSHAITSVRTCRFDSISSASAVRRSSRRATSVTPWPRSASSFAISAPMPEEAPVTSAVELSDGPGSATCGEHIVRDALGPRALRLTAIALALVTAWPAPAAVTTTAPTIERTGVLRLRPQPELTRTRLTSNHDGRRRGAGGDRGGSAAPDRASRDSRAEFIRARRPHLHGFAHGAGFERRRATRRWCEQLQQGKIDAREYYRRSGDLTAEFAALASRAIDEIAGPAAAEGQASRTRRLISTATRTQVRLSEEQARGACATPSHRRAPS